MFVHRHHGCAHAYPLEDCCDDDDETSQGAPDALELGFDLCGIAPARDLDTSKSYGMFSCSKASNEVNYLAGKFTRQVMGSNNVDSCNRT